MMKQSILIFILLSMILEPAISQLVTTHRTMSREGWSVGVEASYGISSINNQVLSLNKLDNNDFSWLSTPENCMSYGLNGYYFFNEYFGIRSGILYNEYVSNFYLKGTFTEDKLSTDINGDYFYLVQEAEYDSDLTMGNISIPVVVNLVLGKPGKNGLFLEGGFVFDQKLTASHHTQGTYTTYGIYPDHPEVTRIIGLEELGFIPEESIDNTDIIRTSFFNVSAYAAFGLNLAFGYLHTLRIGAEFLYAARDIGMGMDYERIFGNAAYESSTTMKYGFKVSYILKI